MMVEVTAAETLPRTCRGGEHCCRPDFPCGEASGDCNQDQDCQGALVCGTDNCMTSGGHSGGRWDEDDDCNANGQFNGPANQLFNTRLDSSGLVKDGINVHGQSKPPANKLCSAPESS